MGGAAFPTQVKLTVPAGKKVEHLIINGVECEPYLTSDHRVMLERPTPFAFPLLIERLRERLSTEKLSDRIARMLDALESAAGSERGA